MRAADRSWLALKRVVEEALDLPEEARDALLEARCPDAARRAEATRLLRACERAAESPILDAPAAEFAALLLSEVDEGERTVPEALRSALAGRYTIERELGRGGMATVYLAHDERHGRPVALKLLRPGLLPEAGSAQGAAWFEREIEIAARLSHPHILPLYDSGAVGGLLFYITPFVDGETLRVRLRRTERLPLAESLRLLRDVARALAYAHRQGLVHRDIKPANILLNREGDALVADFGVAKGLVAARALTDGKPTDDRPTKGKPADDTPAEEKPSDEKPRDSSPGEERPEGPLILGTPAYMAPEQVNGDPDIDARADLYALGAVAYELLTGAPPFAGQTGRALLDAHQSKVPEPVEARRPDVPKPLAALVDRLLAKNPGDRPRDADEVLAILDAVAAASDPRSREAGLRGAVRRSLTLTAALTIPLLAWLLLPGRDLPAGSERSLAVLPFASDSGSLEEAALGEGLADAVIGALGRLPSVRVAARTPAAAIASRDLDVRQIGTLLNVATVLEGSVQWDGDRLHVAASLARASDSRTLWSETYEVPSGELFALQERIARDVAAALPGGAGEPLPPRLVERGTDDREAYELYQKGRHLWNTRQRDGLQRALTYFEQAIGRDSAYARAYAGIADTWTFLGIFGHVPPREAFPRARTAAERAIALDSLLVDGHATLAHLMFVYEWNWPGAEAAIERAIALDPRYPNLRMYYASYLHSVGRPEEALAQLALAAEMDPLTPTGVFGGRIHVDTRQPDAAIRVLEQEVDLDPRRDLAHQLLAHAYLQKGAPEEAIAAMRRAAALSGPRDSAQLAYIYARAGQAAEARRALARLLDSGRPLDLLGFHLAMAYAGLGDSDEAFRWLEAAHAQRASYMNLLAVTAGFESLRSDPRFDRLLQRMGLR